MERLILKVKSNIKQGRDFFILHLVSNKLPEIIPGQFLNIEIEGKYLNRPISICDLNDNEITLAIKVNGEGTKLLSRLKENDDVKVLLPLGNGIDLTKFDKEILLIGGGIGVAPLVYIAKKCKENGLKVTTVLGFRDRDNTLLFNEFNKYSDELFISYDSDNENVVTKIKENDLTDIRFFACGPTIMLKSVSELCEDGYCSLESRMGCGFGTCMGCSTGFKGGNKRICKDGPVFNKEEILWENLM